MAYDAATATVVLFGGSGKRGYLGGTWTWGRVSLDQASSPDPAPQLSTTAWIHAALTRCGRTRRAWGWEVDQDIRDALTVARANRRRRPGKECAVLARLTELGNVRARYGPTRR
jgi:hypothetical protein